MRGAADLKNSVRGAYSEAACQPDRSHPFPVGRAFAEELGYPSELLRRVPQVSVEAFTGVSNVSLFAHLPAGATVLDLGCGAGLDTFIAAERVASGTVFGVDFSWEMLARAQRSCETAAASNVRFVLADAERLPFRGESIDVALVNGIFNLNPGRKQIFSELARVIKRGGEMYAAELLLRAPLPDEMRENSSDWFA